MNKGRMRRVSHSLISLLLVLSVMVSMFVPFSITVFAEDDGFARGSDIYALLYYIDANKRDGSGNIIKTNNLELVFQRGGTADPNRTLLKTYSDFADRDCGLYPPWIAEGYSTSSYQKPTYTTAICSIYKVTIKDKIAPKYMSGWFWDQRSLVEVNNLENINTSECFSFYSLFNYSWALRELDLSMWDTSKIQNASAAFAHQGNSSSRGLKKLNVSTWELPNCTNISSFLVDSQVEELDISSMRPTACVSFGSMLDNNKMLRTVKIGPMTCAHSSDNFFTNMFSNCVNLESVYSEGEPVYGKVDLSAWKIPSRDTAGVRRFARMFQNCAKITEIDFGDLAAGSAARSDAYNDTFSGCTSLESINFNFAKGGLNAIEGSSTFKNCESLVKLDFSGLQTPRTGETVSYGLSQAGNIYEGCNELKEVVFNEYYPPAGESGVSVPPKPTWAKIKNPDGTAFTGKQVLSAEDLFLDFQPSYAGTWVAVDKIVLNANGGRPNQQSIDGSRYMTLDYDPSEIVDPQRNGYDFAGWYSEREDGQGVLLENGTIAQSWTYYAHWDEHQYTLVLDGNGGTVPNDYTVPEGGVVSEDRTTITFTDLDYSKFQELSNQMFYKDSNSVLASWNTRKNGKGTSYFATDSVNKLAEADGATATLYAQWHEPEAIITFDSNGGSEVNSKEYKVNDPYGDLPEPYRAGYTFTGWYTAEDELGHETKITSESLVTGTQTLHAKWEPNPAITFDANGGTINNESTVTKVVSYGYKINTLPVPHNGSATLKGWFTAETGGTEISENTFAYGNATYYAQWGYQPKFVTNGGTFDTYPEGGYEIINSSNYKINELPTVTKDHSTFDGWYFGDRKVNVGDTLDLSSDNVITARWNDTVQRTVTLVYNNGLQPGVLNVFDGSPVGQLPTPKKTGFNFEGWYDENDTKYTADGPQITSDVTLTAKWTEQDVTVTFDPQGGTMVDSNTMKVQSGMPLPTLPGANYLNARGEIQYRFGGWYTEPNGQGDLLTTTTPITANTTYYAKWVDLKTVTDDYVYAIHWATISNTEVTNTGGHLVFHPTVSGDINARLYISLEKPNGGTLNLPKKALKITIPRHLFESDKEQNNLASFFSASTNDDFKAEYSQDGKSIILYNQKAISKNTIFTPEFNISPKLLNGGYIDENGYYQGDYYQKNFDVQIDVAPATSEQVVTPAHYSRNMGLEVHTSANTVASKARADVALNWNPEWGTEPVDAKEYFYVIWSLTADISNSNQPYQIKWSEDTIHDGTVVYSNPALDKYNATPYTSDGSRTTKVVTKHRRADVHNEGTSWAQVHNEAILSVLWNNEFEQKLRASRTADVYVPSETSGVFTFGKSIPNSDKQNAHTINGGQELILNGEPERMPMVYNIAYEEHENDDHPTWNANTETYKTKARTIAIEDGNPGDVLIATDRGASSRAWNSPYIKTLNQSDYYFSELAISLTEFDAVQLDGKWTDPFKNTDTANYGDIVVYAKTAGSDNLMVVKTLRGVSEATVTLPKNTVYFKVEHVSDYFTTFLKVEPTLYLTDSNHVRELVSEDVGANRNTLVMNKCKLTTKREGEEPEVTLSSDDGDAWRSTYLLNISSSTLYAAKNCSTVSLTEGSTEETSVVIGGWNYNDSVLGYKKYVKSGIFHDLLPKDCTVDRSTVFVVPRTENTKDFPPNSDITNWANYYDDKPGMVKTRLPEGYFSVTFTDDWEGSGRTMMIVTVNAPEDAKYTGFDVFYKLKTTHANINIYGINLINSVSFTDTTNGQSTPDGRSGNKAVLDVKSRDYYSSVDSPQTAFATAKTNLNQPPLFQYGADSTVRAEGSVYSKHEVVGLNTDYNYNVSFTGGDQNQTSDIVIYDVIEKQIDGPTSEWHGGFKSLDLTGITSLATAGGTGTCAPVVYYATKSRDSFTAADMDISNTDIWTTVKPADDQITAIAIDCTKTSSGGDFVLDAKKTLSFNINMHSPMSEKQSELETYNEAIIRSKIDDIAEYVESKARTSVTLRFSHPRIEKSAFPESGTSDKPESVVQNSVLEYVLKVTNPDKELSMTNIVVEDVVPSTMKFNNTIRAKLGDGEDIPISQAARISVYSVKEVGENTTFTATISSLAPGETITITVPVTVTAGKDTVLTNTATVKEVNGVSTNIESNETYHIVSESKVKVLKVNGKGEPLPGAELQILDKDKNVMTLTDDEGNSVTQFTSTTEVLHFNLGPGTYYVHEVTPPTDYNASADIQFTIDDEGIINVDGNDVSYVAVTNTPQYKVIFHENKYNGSNDEMQKEFRVYEPSDLNADKSITHFYDIPEWAGDEYVFMGWYHDSGYNQITKTQGIDANATIAANFENDKFTTRDTDYHLYARWIKVGKVDKDSTDTNIISGNQYRGFGLAGVQIREPQMKDSNYNNEITPGGLRFVTSISEDLLRQIDEVSDKQVLTEEGYSENVEYGYVVATKANIDTFVNHYGAVPSEYSLQYKGENVNGVNTLTPDKLDVKTDYRYITNVLCTSSHPINGNQNGTEVVKDDHRNFDNYRLYTLVVTYDDAQSASRKGESINARAYIRYYDANGKLRVFYNIYDKTKYYGGCMCSYNQVAEMAIPVQEKTTEETP